MKLTWQRITGGITTLAILVPATWYSVLWVASRAHAEDVEQVTAQVARTADAVEGLTLIVYTDQLAHAHAELAALRVEKRQHSATWSASDEEALLAAEARIHTLQTQLDQLVEAAAAETAALADEAEQ